MFYYFFIFVKFVVIVFICQILNRVNVTHNCLSNLFVQKNCF